MLVLSKAPEKTKTTNTWVTVADVKKQLNIPDEFTDDDDFIEGLIEVAFEMVEDDTNADFIDTSNVLTHEITHSLDRIICICQAPFRALSKIEYKTDEEETYSELENTKYKVVPGFHWFTIQLFETPTADSIRFTFTTGYTNSNYPKKLRHAVVLKAAELFEAERSSYVDSSVTKIDTYNMLISKHRRQYFG
ncbi:MAG: head-tail connector protein [Salinivirgaceae bacterium]